MYNGSQSNIIWNHLDGLVKKLEELEQNSFIYKGMLKFD